MRSRQVRYAVSRNSHTPTDFLSDPILLMRFGIMYAMLRKSGWLGVTSSVRTYFPIHALVVQQTYTIRQVTFILWSAWESPENASIPTIH